MSVSISSTFQRCESVDQLAQWESEILKLEADKRKNPQNAEIDERDIEYYKDLIAHYNEMDDLIEAYRHSDNDETLAKEIRALIKEDKTIEELLQIDAHVRSLKESI